LLFHENVSQLPCPQKGTDKSGAKIPCQVEEVIHNTLKVALFIGLFEA
jgi:hypothetical protein